MSAMPPMPGSVPATRPITDAEAAVVERALAAGATDTSALALLERVRDLRVVGRCECGCASIDFRVLPEGEVPRIVANAIAKAPDGEHLGVIVRAVDDGLAGLEVYNYSDRPAPLPVVASISGYEDESQIDTD